MILGVRGLALIKSFEQCRLTAYKDGGGVWTIGWGHTGREVVEGLTWTQAKADDEFHADCAEAQEQVNRCLGDTAVNQQMFDALVSFEYNTGALATSTLLKLLNNGNPIGAAREFTRWDHDNGVQVRGLTKRRLAEQALFMSI